MHGDIQFDAEGSAHVCANSYIIHIPTDNIIINTEYIYIYTLLYT